MVDQKKGTIHLIDNQSTWWAGLDAGPAGYVQPMNYFVRHDFVSPFIQHTFYYEYRALDATGIHTIESTVDGAGDKSKRYFRTWGDVNTYQHRSWWAYPPGGGDSPAYAKTASGADSACYGIRGQNVWYTYYAPGPHTVTLTGISGGDPDLWVLDANLNFANGTAANSSSTYTNQTNESVYVPYGGTFYTFVHIWASDGACVNYTISW